MTAVTDTSPVCYLVLIGEVELLQKLFGSDRYPDAKNSRSYPRTCKYKDYQNLNPKIALRIFRP